MEARRKTPAYQNKDKGERMKDQREAGRNARDLLCVSPDCGRGELSNHREQMQSLVDPSRQDPVPKAAS